MLDTTVLVAGSGWSRWPREVLLARSRGEIQIVLSPYVLAQARRILAKSFPEHLQRFEQFVARTEIEIAADPTPDEVSARADLVRDVTNVPVALVAINAKVDYLVSEDKDLTVQDETTEELRKRLRVLLSGTFLREALGWTGDDLEQLRGRNWQDLDAAGEAGSV